MTDRPDHRELKVMKELSAGPGIEDMDHFAHVGPKTFKKMLDKGWIEPAYDKYYGVDGVRLTALGNQVWAANWKRA